MKTIKLAVALGLISGAAQAATITVSAGLPSQGITMLVDGVVLPNFNVSVGFWDTVSSTFTTFGSPIADTAEVNGAFTATGPAAFNSSLISVFVGTGGNIATSGQAWAVFTTVAGTTFPADVSQATGVTFTMTTPAAVTAVASGGLAGTGFVAGGVNTNNFNIVTIPEPSTALLGAIGVMGLLRRRRN